MSKIQYFNYAGWGTQAKEELNYSQVVRIGNELRISGQGQSCYESQKGGKARVLTCVLGGWKEDGSIPESEEEQIEVAWQNVEKALKHAGLKNPFDNIFSIRSLHVNKHYDAAALFSKVMKKIFTKHQPIWTLVGVERLGLETMKVEIEVVAVVDDE